MGIVGYRADAQLMRGQFDISHSMHISYLHKYNSIFLLQYSVHAIYVSVW